MAGSAGATNPISVINDNPMSARQWIVVGLMVLLNALDGFDVLSSAFAAPGISREWGIPRSELGIVLSAELIGMGFGSLLLGRFADYAGRKPAMLICLVIMAAGMYMAHSAASVASLTGYRLFTGLGIGGMLASTNAVVAETTSQSSRNLAMALYVAGYPIGGVVGGYAAQSWLLVDHDWRAVFVFGAAATAAMIPLIVLLVPETPAFHAARRKPDALGRINRSLRTLRQPTIGELPPVKLAGPKPKVSDILSKPGLRAVSWLLALGYTFHTFTFYFILKYTAQIVSDAGFTQPQAASALTLANVGGAIGGLLFGFLMNKWDIKGPTISAMLLGVAAVAWFALGHDTLGAWRLAAFLAMFFLNAAIVGFYAAFARGFPAYARVTGTGFALAVGRAGAAGSLIIAGILFTTLGNHQLMPVSMIMALGAAAGSVMIWLLPLRDADKDQQGADATPASG
jgi:MFS family permease